MLLKVIPTKQSFDNIQISQFSSENSEVSGAIGKYVLIPLSEESFSLCKAFISQETHPAYIDLDRSVIYSKVTLPCGLPKVPLNSTLDCIDTSAIEPLPTPVSIKSISITVVYESVFDVLPSKKCLHHISSIVKDLLKLFVLMRNCVINLECLPKEARLGIYAIIITSLDCDEHDRLGFISSKTCLTISRVLSRKLFEQTINFSGTPEKIFPREAYGLLKSIVDLKAKWKNSKAVIQPPHKVCWSFFCQRACPCFKFLILLMTLFCLKVIIVGPSGSGKSSLVSYIAAKSGATLVSYSDYSKSNGIHSDNIKLCFSEARALSEERTDGMYSSPLSAFSNVFIIFLFFVCDLSLYFFLTDICILLVENLDLICKRRDGVGLSADNISTTLQLLNLLEEAQSEPNLLIIGTTSKIHNVDPAICTSSTFNFQVRTMTTIIIISCLMPCSPFDISPQQIIIEQSEEDREDILKSLLQPLNNRQYLTLAQEIARMTPGYVAADLALIVHKVACKNDDR